MIEIINPDEVKAEVALLDAVTTLRNMGRPPKQIVKTVLALLYLSNYKLCKKEENAS